MKAFLRTAFFFILFAAVFVGGLVAVVGSALQDRAAG